MLEQIATVKLLALIGYAALFFILVRSRIAVGLRINFALYLFGLGFWQLTSLVVTIVHDPATATLWYNLQSIGVSLQSFIFLPLTRAFLGHRRHRSIDVAVYACCAASIVMGILQLMVHTVVPGTAGYYVPRFEVPLEVNITAAYLVWAWGVGLLVRGLFRERPRLQRLRIGYVLAGSLIVMIGGATNFTPLQAYPVDTLCTLINALLVSYAVTRYRLVDTGTVLRRALVGPGDPGGRDRRVHPVFRCRGFPGQARPLPPRSAFPGSPVSSCSWSCLSSSAGRRSGPSSTASPAAASSTTTVSWSSSHRQPVPSWTSTG